MRVFAVVFAVVFEVVFAVVFEVVFASIAAVNILANTSLVSGSILLLIG